MRSCILHGPTAPPARTAEHTRALQCLPGRRPGRRPCGCGGAACLQSMGRHARGGCWPRARHVTGVGQAAASRTSTVARQAAQGRPRRAGRQRRTRRRGGGPTCSAASTRSRKPSTASSCTLPGAMECGHCHLRVRSARSRNVSRSNATRPPALCARRRHRVGYDILLYRVMEPTLWSMVHYPRQYTTFYPRRMTPRLDYVSRGRVSAVGHSTAQRPHSGAPLRMKGRAVRPTGCSVSRRLPAAPHCPVCGSQGGAGRPRAGPARRAPGRRRRTWKRAGVAMRMPELGQRSDTTEGPICRSSSSPPPPPPPACAAAGAQVPPFRGRLLHAGAGASVAPGATSADEPV